MLNKPAMVQSKAHVKRHPTDPQNNQYWTLHSNNHTIHCLLSLEGVIIFIWERLTSSSSKFSFMSEKHKQWTWWKNKTSNVAKGEKKTLCIQVCVCGRARVIDIDVMQIIIRNLLLLSSQINLHLWGSKGRRLDEMQVRIPATHRKILIIC